MGVRKVNMEVPGGLVSGCGNGPHVQNLEHTLALGVKYAVMPVHHAKLKHRGRTCIFKKPRRVREDTGKDTYAWRAWVQFEDNGKFGFVAVGDLVPAGDDQMLR